MILRKMDNLLATYSNVVCSSAGVEASWESIVNYKDVEATKRTQTRYNRYLLFALGCIRHLSILVNEVL